MDEKREISLDDAGIIIGILSGVMAIFESSLSISALHLPWTWVDPIAAILPISVFYIPWTRGWVGLIASILLLAGAITVYKGRTVIGVVIMFFSSLISELTGGYLGGVISELVPIHLYFIVSRWMSFGLLSSILILFSLWKKKRSTVKPTVNPLEACSRLALIEGQKENEMGKGEEEKEWMRKERYL